MASRCDECMREEYMPFACKFCKGRYCAEHRLPENHDCERLQAYKERLRAEGKLYSGEASSTVSPVVREPIARRLGLHRLLARLDGKVTYALLGLMAAFGVVQILVLYFVPGAFGPLFTLGPEFYLYPWTLVTSIFSHAGFDHLFFNGLTLFFFGPTLESLIGSRRFLGLFVGAGVVAGLAEVVFFDYVLPQALVGPDHVVLGASGAIMGVLGALTLLAPRLTVLVFFIIPAPLWLIVAGYAFFDIALLGTKDRVAHLAHLAGLAVGLLYGKRLHDDGLRVRVMSRPSLTRRYL